MPIDRNPLTIETDEPQLVTVADSILSLQYTDRRYDNKLSVQIDPVVIGSDEHPSPLLEPDKYAEWEKTHKPTPRPSMFGAGPDNNTIGLSVEQGTITGRIGAIIGEAMLTSGKADPDFNPYDLLTPEFIKQHPELEEDFESGKIAELPNRQAFDNYVASKQGDMYAKKRFGEIPWYTSMAATLPVQVGEAVTGGKVLSAGMRLAGAGSTLAAIGDYATARGIGPFAARATTAAGGNALYELGMKWADPFIADKAPDANTASAAMMGLAFASGFEGLLFAGRKGATAIKLNRVGRALQNVRDSFGPVPETMKIDDMIDFNVSQLQKDLAASVDGPLTRFVIKDVKTEPLITTLQKKYADAGQDLHINILGESDYVEAFRTLQSLEKRFNSSRPAIGKAIAEGKIDAATGEFFSKTSDLLSGMTPWAKKLGESSLFSSRAAYHTFFDDSRVLDESVTHPLTNTIDPSAEGFRYGERALTGKATAAIYDTLVDHLKAKGGAFSYIDSSGNVLNVRNRWDMPNFQRAITDYLFKSEEVERGIRSASDLIDIPSPVKKAGDQIIEYFREKGRRMHDVEMLKVPPSKRPPYHLTRMWKISEVTRDPLTFRTKLVAQMQQNRLFDPETNARIVPENRPVLADILDRQELSDIKRDLAKKAKKNAVGGNTGPLLGGNGKVQITPDMLIPNEHGELKITEAQIAEFGPGAINRYLDQISKYIDEQAKAITKSMTDPLAPPNVLGERKLNFIRPSNFIDYLETDIERILAHYDHRTSGRIAMRRSIQQRKDLWGPLAKQLLGEDLDLSHEQIVRIVNEDFRRHADLARAAGDSTLADDLMTAKAQMVDVLDLKARELQGMGYAGNNHALNAGSGRDFVQSAIRFAGRNSLKMPGMAFLGKALFSGGLPDVAGLMLYKRMGTDSFRIIGEYISQLAQGVAMRNVPKRGLEGLMVALDEEGISRMWNLADLDDMAPAENVYGRSATGKALAAGEKTIDALNNTFYKTTGLVRSTTINKRIAARLIISEMFRDARKFAKAGEFMKTGISEAEAIHKAGLSKADAARANRLGMNAQRAGEFLDAFRQHGETIDGKPLIQINADEFAKYNRDVFPNFEKWANKELRDVFAAMVNSEVDNVIVTPKIMSKPVWQTRQQMQGMGWLGRMFNQFQSFSFAFGNQFMPLVGQRPLVRQANWMMAALGIAAITDALHNNLSGRRSLEDTARLWTERPEGMFYAALNRSGLTGWMQRPMGILDSTSYGLGPMLGNNVSSMMAAQALSIGGNLGPFAAWADNISQGLVLPIMRDEVQFDAKRWDLARRALPFQNLLWTDMLYRLTHDADIGSPWGRGKGIDLFITKPAFEASKKPREAQP